VNFARTSPGLILYHFISQLSGTNLNVNTINMILNGTFFLCVIDDESHYILWFTAQILKRTHFLYLKMTLYIVLVKRPLQNHQFLWFYYL